MIGDIGMGEFLVIAVIAVLILGPDKLPKAIATGMSWLRVLRDQAARARSELSAAVDLDPSITDDVKKSLQDIGDLHPRRIAASLLTDPMTPQTPAQPTPPPAPRAPMTPQTEGAAAPAPQPTAAFDPDAT